MRKELSVEIRKKIINLHAAKGHSYTAISELLSIPKSTIAGVISRWKILGRIGNAPRTGRKTLITLGLKRILKRIVDKEPTLSCRKIAGILKDNHQVEVTRETVRKYISEFGYRACIRRKKPLISKKNRKARLEFARKYLDEPPEFWERVLFTDESKYNIFGSDGRVKVWRKPSEGLNPKYTSKTVKHGGGGVLVWGCMAASGVGKLQIINGIMDQYVYIDILKRNLRPSTDQLGLTGNYIFQQDNDPKHTSHNARLYLLYNTPGQLKFPAQSPDLNPIEHLWEVLERRLREHHARSKSHLQELLQLEWEKIPTETVRNLVASMPNKLRAVIRANGHATKY